MLFHSYAQCAQPAQRQKTIVWRRTLAETERYVLQQRPRLLGRNDQADQYIRMRCVVFGRRLHDHIDTMGKGIEKISGRPGVVHDDQRAVCMRDLGDCGDILYFKRM